MIFSYYLYPWLWLHGWRERRWIQIQIGVQLGIEDVEIKSLMNPIGRHMGHAAVRIADNVV